MKARKKVHLTMMKKRASFKRMPNLRRMTITLRRDQASASHKGASAKTKRMSRSRRTAKMKKTMRAKNMIIRASRGEFRARIITCLEPLSKRVDAVQAVHPAQARTKVEA